MNRGWQLCSGVQSWFAWKRHFKRLFWSLNVKLNWNWLAYPEFMQKETAQTFLDGLGDSDLKGHLVLATAVAVYDTITHASHFEAVGALSLNSARLRTVELSYEKCG